MASERALHVLHMIDIGERFLAPAAAEALLRAIAQSRRSLERAQRELPPTGFGLHGEAYGAIAKALGTVGRAETEAFDRLIDAKRTAARLYP